MALLGIHRGALAWAFLEELMVEHVMAVDEVAEPFPLRVEVAEGRLEAETLLGYLLMLRLTSTQEVPELLQVLRAGHLARHSNDGDIAVRICLRCRVRRVEVAHIDDLWAHPAHERGRHAPFRAE